MTTFQASDFVISSINKFAVEAVKRGMINNESDMASFIDSAASYFSVSADIVKEIVLKIADKIKKQDAEKAKNFTFETVSEYYAKG